MIVDRLPMIDDPFARIIEELLDGLRPLRFRAPVSHVYNPLEYARDPWNQYVSRFGQGPKEVLLLGMNPGPFGMAQVGVPFGGVESVRSWMGIEGPVGRPDREHPKRPILGFACLRTEVSGARLWGWARARFGTPEAFFARFFVLNHCPLAFMGDSGVNITPDKLIEAERRPLMALCDGALRQTINHFQPRFVLGVGKYAEERIRGVVPPGSAIVVGSLPHPSPASPAANRGWAALADRALAELGVGMPTHGG